MFLFIPAVFGTIFSLLQFYLGVIRQQTDAIAVLLALLLSVGFPVYVGYYRGGIKLDSITERARGWIYLLNGLYSYVYPMLQDLVRSRIPNEYSMLNDITTFGLAFPVVFIARKIGSRVLSLFGKTTSANDKEAFRNTGMAATFLGLDFNMIARYLRVSPEPWTKPWDFLSNISIWWLLVCFSLVFEIFARIDRPGMPRSLINTKKGFVRFALSMASLILSLVVVQVFAAASKTYPALYDTLVWMCLFSFTSLVISSLILLRRAFSLQMLANSKS